MSVFIAIGGTAVVLGLLAACGAEPTPPASTQPLTEADSGRTIELPVGGRIAVALEGNPTTGFRWEVGSGDPSVVRLSGEPEFRSSSDALGAAGRFVFRFEAVASGRTSLKLVYRRPFEKDAPPARTFVATVTVK